MDIELCPSSATSIEANPWLVGLAILFATYIGLDAIASSLAIHSKLTRQ